MRIAVHKEKPHAFEALSMVLFILGLMCLPAEALRFRHQEPNRIEKWAADIDQLAAELPQRHKDLFHVRSEADFQKDILELKASLPSLSDEEIIFALAGIVASFGDSHTMLGFRPKIAFPLSFHWFKDGIFCVQAYPDYGEALNCRLLEIGGRSIDDVITTLSAAIPHENRSQLMKSIPGYLVFAEMLYGAGIIADQTRTVFAFERREGGRFEIEMPSVSMKSGIRPVSEERPDTPLPLYRKYQKSIYDFEYLTVHKTVYVVYNSCRERPDKPFTEFIKDIFKTVEQNIVERIVIDLRNNGGGNSGVFEPMISELAKREDLNRADRLFVIIGRRTFSSAVLNAVQLRNQTRATFVGEPSGGKPNHFGEVKMFGLKNSKLPVSYSTKYFTMSKQDSDAFYPDVSVELSIADFIGGRDPVMEWILGSGGADRRD